MRKYDVVFSLGAACSCSQALREAGLQFATFPFDWLLGPNLRERAQIVADGFPGWLETGPFSRLPEEPRFSNRAWYRDGMGFSFIHDFGVVLPLEEELPAVRAKYRRRIDRLTRLLDGAGSALAVYIESGSETSPSAEDAANAREALSRRWPGVAFDVLALKFAAGVPLSRRIDESGDGWRLVQYDFKDPKEDVWRVDWRQVAKWLRREYAVVDYRTDDERRNWKRRARERKYADFKASCWLDYVSTKISYKIYKHFRTRLARKGVI